MFFFACLGLGVVFTVFFFACLGLGSVYTVLFFAYLSLGVLGATTARLLTRKDFILKIGLIQIGYNI